jgi:predicted SnoaL-like aldol condensation-catalyzing enzyme
MSDQTKSGDLGATARQAMISILRDRDTSAVDRYFAEPFIQHDPNVADGLPGLKAFVADVARSPKTDITIYRTVVDHDIVMLHSKYEGMPGFSGPVIAFDLFRFKNGKIVEHWGGQEAEEGLNLSGRSQVDGATDVVDGNYSFCVIGAIGGRVCPRTRRFFISGRWQRASSRSSRCHLPVR